MEFKLDLGTILSLVSIVIYVLLIVLTVIFNNTKSKKTKQTAQKTYDIIKTIQSLVINAEKHFGFSGPDKFDFVMTGLDKYLMEQKINLDIETKTNLIENEITVSNNVNTRETKKHNEDVEN